MRVARGPHQCQGTPFGRQFQGQRAQDGQAGHGSRMPPAASTPAISHRPAAAGGIARRRRTCPRTGHEGHVGQEHAGVVEEQVAAGGHEAHRQGAWCGRTGGPAAA